LFLQPHFIVLLTQASSKIATPKASSKMHY